MDTSSSDSMEYPVISVILVISVYSLIMFCQFHYYNFLCTLVQKLLGLYIRYW